MSGSIVSPTAGDVLVLAAVCIVYCSLSFLFLTPSLEGSPGLSSQGFIQGRCPGYARDTLTRLELLDYWVFNEHNKTV